MVFHLSILKEQLEKLEQKKKELDVTVRELDKQMQAERDAAAKKAGGFRPFSTVFGKESGLKTELAGVEEALTSSRKETGQVLSDLKESRKENVELKEKVKGLDQTWADSKQQQEVLAKKLKEVMEEGERLKKETEILKQAAEVAKDREENYKKMMDKFATKSKENEKRWKRVGV